MNAYGADPDWNKGVLGAIKEEIVVRVELGGTNLRPDLPTREAWNAMLERYAPGCGSPTYVPGTNGGKMPCGAWLNWPDGTRTQQFCPHCGEEVSPRITTV